MKRFFLLIMVFLLIGSIAIADTIIDWSQYSDDEIDAIIDEAYEELNRRMDGGFFTSLVKDQKSSTEMD